MTNNFQFQTFREVMSTPPPPPPPPPPPHIHLGPLILDKIRTLAKALQKQNS